MRNKTKKIYLSADQLEKRAAEKLQQAEQLPAGEAQQYAIKIAGQLRSYAAMKRLLVRQRTSLEAELQELFDVDR
jgi:hypothetical protein